MGESLTENLTAEKVGSWAYLVANIVFGIDFTIICGGQLVINLHFVWSEVIEAAAGM
jgi:hypothetical protein